MSTADDKTLVADPAAFLKSQGELPDAEMDLGGCAVALGGVEKPGRNLERYARHLRGLGSAVATRFDDLCAEGAADDAGTRLAALKRVIHEENGYSGDEQDYENLANADMVQVIDRRKGLPVALAILYISAGREAGWAVEGLNFPAHFICRLAAGGAHLIFDPFSGCAVLQAPQLRELLKRAMGPAAELSADYYTPAENRDILLRLQNNIKTRLIEMEDYAGALSCVERMRLIAPGDFRLLLDAGVLYAKTDQPRAAIRELETYIDTAPAAKDREDAALLLQHIKQGLN